MKALATLLLLSSFSVFGADYINYSCKYQGERTSFSIQIEDTENPYKNVFIEKKLYRLGSGGSCMALSCTEISGRLSNTRGSIKIVLKGKTAEGKIDSAHFTCVKKNSK